MSCGDIPDIPDIPGTVYLIRVKGEAFNFIVYFNGRMW